MDHTNIDHLDLDSHRQDFSVRVWFAGKSICCVRILEEQSSCSKRGLYIH